TPGCGAGETHKRAVAEGCAPHLRPHEVRAPAARDVEVEVGLLQAVVDAPRAASEALRLAEARARRVTPTAPRCALRDVDALAAAPRDDGAAIGRDAQDMVEGERRRDPSDLRSAAEAPAGRTHAGDQPDRG